MGKILKAGGVLAACLAVLVVAYRAWRVSLYSDLPVSKIADIEAGEMVFLIFGILLVVVVVLVMWAIKQAKREDLVPGARADVVDTTWRELPGYYPPQAQIAGPRYITVPRFTTNGTAQPLGATSPAPAILQTQIDSELLTVPIDKLMRFLALATPKRTEWSGKPAIYGDCLRFADAHGLLDHKPGGGFVWKSAYPLESRRQWVMQFEQSDAGARDE